MPRIYGEAGIATGILVTLGKIILFDRNYKYYDQCLRKKKKMHIAKYT